ncbi:DedA family protein [Candidatus Gracilibacteria bacterium]|nr:DedA family protein [Candidatus Gracilibacteria bacterium]
MHALLENLIAWFGTLSYLDIFVLMAMESSIIPVPSEFVMIPAGWIAKSGGLDPVLATLVGGIGSVVGATANYFILGRWVGKPFLEKYGKYILITKEKYQRSEDLFLKNQNLYTFLGRLIPVVRHLISIPAGIFRMPLTPFWIITFLGATLWCGILVWLGWTFGQVVLDIAVKYLHEFKLIGVPLIILYFGWKIWGKKSKK